MESISLFLSNDPIILQLESLYISINIDILAIFKIFILENLDLLSKLFLKILDRHLLNVLNGEISIIRLD